MISLLRSGVSFVIMEKTNVEDWLVRALGLIVNIGYIQEISSIQTLVMDEILFSKIKIPVEK